MLCRVHRHKTAGVPIQSIGRTWQNIDTAEVNLIGRQTGTDRQTDRKTNARRRILSGTLMTWPIPFQSGAISPL